MNQKDLKNKVYQLLFDKVSKVNFKKDIQVLNDVYKPDSDSLLHDLIHVNYNTQDYKQRLIKVISKYTAEEELISLTIYQNCMNIIETTDQKVAFNHMDNLGKHILIVNQNIILYMIFID
ncbi:hypothetical protein [uncultured Kordia sp.]|uniref:hypothetical protein n=1 Tax=uncultured Kordia sp. TaxID=507699 RepID=UPI002603145E|nr:hypothetical protein [uncultured Kordia sp.]